MGIETLILAVVFIAAGAVAYSGYQKAKKEAALANAENRGLLYQARQTAMPRRIIYGETRVGGLEAYVTSTGTDNEYIHYILIWSDGPNEEHVSLLFDGVEVGLDGSGDGTGDYAGLVHMETKLGAIDQTVLSQAVTEMDDWGDTDLLLGIHYSWLRLKYDEEVFAKGVPNISSIIKGRNDIYDPVTDTEIYSTNPVLCCNHYMTNCDLGPELDYATRIDETTLTSAAADCDDAITLSTGGTEDRYTFNGTISLDKSTEDIIGTFRQAMAGTIVYIGGTWKFYAGVYTAPTFEITEDMIVEPIKWSTRASKRDRINTMRGTFTTAENNYFPEDFLFYQDTAAVTADGEVLYDDLDLSNTNSVTMVRRIGKIAVQRSRYSRTATLRCNIEALRAVPGLPVGLTYSRGGFSNTPMEVMSWTFIIEGVNVFIEVSLRETNSAIYAWDEDTEDGLSDTSVTEPTVTAPSAPINNTGASPTAISGGLQYSELP